MTQKIDADRMFFLANRADRLLFILKELDDLSEQMDDAGHLKAAHDLIETRWKSEFEAIQMFTDQINKAMALALLGENK